MLYSPSSAAPLAEILSADWQIIRDCEKTWNMLDGKKLPNLCSQL